MQQPSNISGKVIQQLNKIGVTQLHSFQKTAAKSFKEGKNLLIHGESRTGKSTILQVMLVNKLFQDLIPGFALVLTPTTQGAINFRQSMIQIGQFLDLEVVYCIGGQNIQQDLKNIEKYPQVIVGTPVRIAKLMQISQPFRKILQNLEVLVIDNLQILDQVNYFQERKNDVFEVFKELSFLLEEHGNKVQLLLTSQSGYKLPTIKNSQKEQKEENCDVSSNMVEALIIEQKSFIENHLKSNDIEDCLVFIEAETYDKDWYKKIVQKKLNVDEELLEYYCLFILKQISEQEEQQIICFAPNASLSLVLTKILREWGVSACQFDQNMSVQERGQNISMFNQKKTKVMIGTDYICQNLERNSSVDWVLHYQLPNSLTQFKERIKFLDISSKKGKSLSFVTKADQEILKGIEQALGNEFVEFDKVNEEDVMKITNRITQLKKQVIMEDLDDMAKKKMKVQ